MSATLPPLLRAAIRLRDGLTCVYCGATTNLEVDHIWPRKHGGTDDPSNLVTACEACNQEKGTIHVKAFFLHRTLMGYPNTEGQEARLEAARARPLDLGAAFLALRGVQP
jgi:5-methylcytosine-specific restriction endonuclease McrA